MRALAATAAAAALAALSLLPASAAAATAPALPAAGTPAAGTPAAGTPAAGTPAAGTPAAGTPAAGTPAAGTLTASAHAAAGTEAAGTEAAAANKQPSSGKLTDGPDTKQKRQGAPSGLGRGSSWQKRWYRLVPLLLLPGLLMAAVLPFVLPALKMLTMGALMLNNMAFTGALFTLLRNNAFRDNYDHKVVYVNEGYRDEEGWGAGHEGHEGHAGQLGRRGVAPGRGRGRGRRGRPRPHAAAALDAPDPHYEAFVEFEPPAQWWHDDAPAEPAAHAAHAVPAALASHQALAAAPAPDPASPPAD